MRLDEIHRERSPLHSGVKRGHFWPPVWCLNIPNPNTTTNVKPAAQVIIVFLFPPEICFWCEVNPAFAFVYTAVHVLVLLTCAQGRRVFMMFSSKNVLNLLIDFTRKLFNHCPKDSHISGREVHRNSRKITKIGREAISQSSRTFTDEADGSGIFFLFRFACL